MEEKRKEAIHGNDGMNKPCGLKTTNPERQSCQVGEECATLVKERHGMLKYKCLIKEVWNGNDYIRYDDPHHPFLEKPPQVTVSFERQAQAIARKKHENIHPCISHLHQGSNDGHGGDT
jgi:hypothetical protein